MRHPVIAAHRLQSTHPAHLGDAVPGGAGVGAIDHGDGTVSLLGSLGLDAWVRAEAAGLKGEGQGPWFEATGPEMEVFAAYAAELAKTLGSRKGDPGAIWCSWYGLYRDISEASMLEILSDLADLPFGVFQVDDGWQRANGDWSPNPGFASGMQLLSERIRQTGRTSGLWLAPFLVDESSELFERNPHMLLRDESGTPIPAAYNWGQTTFALDVTRQDVLEWLAALMQEVVSWGYRYLKLDFVYAAALPGSYHNPMGGEAAYRQAIATIRAAAGEDVYLLGCGAPIIPSIGVLDGIRVGPDVAPFWDNPDRTLHLADRSGPAAADAITTSAGRFWLKPLIDIDPDVVIFRSRRSLLTSEQRRMLADLAHVCDYRATSDPPRWLDSDERAALEAFLAERPAVQQVDRYRFTLDDREVDFAPVAEGRPW